MLIQEGIDANLRFLIEVRKRLIETEQLLDRPSGSASARVRAKATTSTIWKTVIQRKCFQIASEIARDNRPTVDLLKAIDVVAVNLERIADFCENVVSQSRYLQEPDVLRPAETAPFFAELREGLELIEPALFERDVRRALRICRIEARVDELYLEVFHKILHQLEGGQPRAQSLVTALFIFRYLERMGDSLLNIGEAVLSAFLGERIKVDQYQALGHSLEESSLGSSIGGVRLEAMKETRSGSRVDRVRSAPGETQSKSAIFKDGTLHKLVDERESIARWKSIKPGLVPEVYSFHDHGDHGSILFEYLPGKSLEDLIMQGDPDEIRTGMQSVCSTLREIWTSTRKDEPVSAGFVSQIRQRLGEIYALHPEFDTPASGIGALSIPSFQDALARVEDLDHILQAPFRVYIHGDFNLDNVIYNRQTGEVHFIDLHRSREMDYVQDVSVFLVSNHRLPVFEAPIRKRIHEVILYFYDFACDFAQRSGDTTFAVRLALGLARSFATSTRFVLDPRFARNMFLRARYLVQLLEGWDRSQLERFRVPKEVLLD
ncbi:MAG: PhoU domain-containing protein [Candidatus Eisenbacteria bacterium]